MEQTGLTKKNYVDQILSELCSKNTKNQALKFWKIRFWVIWIFDFMSCKGLEIISLYYNNLFLF